MPRTLSLTLALLALPALASAQTHTDEEEPLPAVAEPPPPRAEPAPQGSAEPGTDEEAPPPGEGAPPDGTAAPGTASASVVVDQREAELQREQEAMVEETGGETGSDEEETDADESLDHELQMGIRVGAGVPFYFGIRYSSGPPCNTSGDQFCLDVGSGIIDLGLSFGVSPDLEIVALGRVGMIGVAPTEQNNVQLGLGIRAYISPESMFKVYLAPSLILDLTPSGAVTGWGDVDFGARGAFGLQLDIVRYFGIWVELGVNILFLRSFGVGPYASGGVEARFP